VLAVWNVDRLERPVKMTLAPADIEGLKGERFAVYEHFSGELTVRGRKEEFPVRLKGWEERLYSVVPIDNGFAAIGLAEKYISPATVRYVTREPGRATVYLAAPGTLVAYCEKRPAEVRLNGNVLSGDSVQYQGVTLKVKVPKGTEWPEIGVFWK
jgi:raffinose synthase